jgi:hypothetical protein
MRKDHQKWDGDPFWWSFYARQIPIEISSWGAIVGTERRSKLKDVGKDSVKGPGAYGLNDDHFDGSNLRPLP